jgi:hypothetical protein
MIRAPRPQPERLQKVAHGRLRYTQCRRDLPLSEPVFTQPNDLGLTGGLRRRSRRSVFVMEMLAVTGGVELQVLGAVIGSDAVAMVDDLTDRQSSSKRLLHDPAVLHEMSFLAVLPDGPTDVSLARELAAEESRPTSARQSLECGHPTGIRAELRGPVRPLGELLEAPSADNLHVVTIPHGTGTRRLKTENGRTWRPVLLAYIDGRLSA